MIGMRVPPLGLRTTTLRTVRYDDHNIKPSAQFLRDKTVRVFSSIGLLKPHTPGTCIYGQDSAHMETSNLVYNYNTPDRGSPFVATSEVETEDWVITDVCLGMAACIAAGISFALWPLLETAVEGKLTWQEFFTAYAIGFGLTALITTPLQCCFYTTQVEFKYSILAAAWFGVVGGAMEGSGVFLIFASEKTLSLVVSISIARCCPLISGMWGLFLERNFTPFVCLYFTVSRLYLSASVLFTDDS